VKDITIHIIATIKEAMESLDKTSEIIMNKVRDFKKDQRKYQELQFMWNLKKRFL